LKGIWTYKKLLPVIDEAHQISLGEGNTPLVHAVGLGELLGLPHLYFKLETCNPTGSYKDRFAAMALSDLRQKGASVCLATSSGNTGAAVAAYSAAAQIPCYLCIVDGAPTGKLQQMQVYGAQTLMIENFGKDEQVSAQVMHQLKALAAAHQSPVQISAYATSPMGMCGVQTIAYELAEAFEEQAIRVFVPAGGGGLTLALIRGFDAWKEAHPKYMLPAIHCVQPKGNDTMATAIRIKADQAQAIARCTSSISGLQVPNVLDGHEVVAGCIRSGGNGHILKDEAIYDAQELLAKKAGIFCEPAGAVAFAGLLKALADGVVRLDDYHVCLVTGSGFKDPRTSTLMASKTQHHYFEKESAAFDYIRMQLEV
jgi:threonine synthase